MKRIIFALVEFGAWTTQATAQKKYGEIKADTAKVRYIQNMERAEPYIYDCPFRKNIILVNEEVTTHVVMPENIKLVDISTNKIIGNQCADNIVRIKPAGRMYNNEMAGTISSGNGTWLSLTWYIPLDLQRRTRYTLSPSRR